VARQPRTLAWEPRALDALEQRRVHARRGPRRPRRDGAHGVNRVQLRAADPQRDPLVLPHPKLGLFYLDDGRTLIVVDVVDARRLRRLP